MSLAGLLVGTEKHKFGGSFAYTSAAAAGQITGLAAK
jgi:hypothetical protein